MRAQQGGEAGQASQINGCNLAGGTNPDASAEAKNSSALAMSAADGFYEKLSKFHESSGLSLAFDFRETSVDLYMLYKEVTERGGYHLVTKDGGWGELSPTLKSKGKILPSPTQLRKLYASLLYQFEQIYYYRSPSKVFPDSGHPGIRDDPNITGKRKHCDKYLPVMLPAVESGPATKRKCNDNSNRLSTGPESAEKKLAVQTLPKSGPDPAGKKLVMQASPKAPETRKDPNAPLGSRSAYQIFLRKECERLKKIHGESSGSHNFRDMAVDAWKSLSQIDRQPYFEESRKDKERFKRELSAYKEQKQMLETKTKSLPRSSKPVANNHKMLWPADDDYHVALQSDSDNFQVPDESAVEVAFNLMKNAQENDATFQINWDEYCGSLDIIPS
ncbi:putative high mobility group B protein 11 [Diospyros lotus]|uniref:putative high mobility group B protein 11 n=1 Tax=Diospyros lotus TaxID=55363 RepID=UPI002257521D|nr:putative high mobility group B protein 11 [Diospyros lotus]